MRLPCRAPDSTAAFELGVPCNPVLNLWICFGERPRMRAVHGVFGQVCRECSCGSAPPTGRAVHKRCGRFENGSAAPALSSHPPHSPLPPTALKQSPPSVLSSYRTAPRTQTSIISMAYNQPSTAHFHAPGHYCPHPACSGAGYPSSAPSPMSSHSGKSNLESHCCGATRR